MGSLEGEAPGPGEGTGMGARARDRGGHRGQAGAHGRCPPRSIGENIQLLVERPDGTYCFRLHRDRVYYVR